MKLYALIITSLVFRLAAAKIIPGHALRATATRLLNDAKPSLTEESNSEDSSDSEISDSLPTLE